MPICEQQALGRPLAPQQLPFFERFDGVQQQAGLRAHHSGIVEHLIPEPLGLISIEPHSGPLGRHLSKSTGYLRASALKLVARTEQGPPVFWDRSLYCNRDARLRPHRCGGRQKALGLEHERRSNAPEEQTALAAWISERDSKAWDDQIKQDFCQAEQAWRYSKR